MIKEWDLVDSRADKDYGVFKVRVDAGPFPENERAR